MNRRSFLQSMAAAFSAAAMGITFKPVTQSIRYELFCDDWYGGGGRYNLTTPFAVGDTVAASDGRILLTHPGGGLLDNGDRRVPDIGQLWWGDFETGGFRPLGRPVMEPYRWKGGVDRLCVTCFGRGILDTGVPCPCDDPPPKWEPAWDYTGPPDIPCSKCNDIGRIGVICPVCKGDRWVEAPEAERIGDGQFEPAFVAKIRTLGEVDVKCITVPKHGWYQIETQIALFRGANGVRGMLMGLQG